MNTRVIFVTEKQNTMDKNSLLLLWYNFMYDLVLGGREQMGLGMR